MTENNLSKQNYINGLLNSYFNLFVVIFISFLLVIAYFTILKPKADETTNAIAENISSHERLLQAEKNKLSSLQEAISSYEKIDQLDLERVNSLLPNDYDKEALFGEIEEMITKNGFIPTSIILTKEVPSEEAALATSSKIGVINIDLSVASVNYAGMKNLLKVLESNLRILDVKDLSLSGESAGTLKIDTYYYKK